MWPLLALGAALASPPDLARDYSTAPTPASLATDLVRGTPSERRFAARELARQARVAERLDARTFEDDLVETETTVAYRDLRADVIPSARAALAAHPDVRGPCADILASLHALEALPELRALAAEETRAAVRRRLDRAIRALAAP
jgi:hypothetical protein